MFIYDCTIALFLDFTGISMIDMLSLHGKSHRLKPIKSGKKHA